MNKLTKSDTDMMIHATTILFNEIKHFVNKYQNEHLPHSQAEKEIGSFPDMSSLVKTAYSQSSILIEAVADHFSALTKVLSEPVQAFAPWTCVRVSFESSALAIWLLDNEIDVKERVRRSLAFRYDGLNEQLKIARLHEAEEGMKNIEARMDAVEDNAFNFGYRKVRNKKNKRISIGKHMPSRTDITNMYLGDTASYRVLSAIVHSHPWALQQVGFWQPLSSAPNYLEKRIKLDLVASICQIGAISFSKALWYKTVLFGWNVEDLENIFQPVFDTLKIPQENHFWIRAQIARNAL